MFSGAEPSALDISTPAPYRSGVVPGLRSGVSPACRTIRGQESPVHAGGKVSAWPLPCGVSRIAPPLRTTARNRWPLPEPSSKVPSEIVVSKLYDATYSDAAGPALLAGVASMRGVTPLNATYRLWVAPP